MSAVKVILAYMENIGDANTDAICNLTRKLVPPLVTLLNYEPEVQYVAICNNSLIVQTCPNIFEDKI
eukprot:1926398-Ditylum_brightwellii.AAC.1